MGITIADVAKLAGVTISTVSYTLSGKRPVSEQARARVLRAIEELHYQPHALGKLCAVSARIPSNHEDKRCLCLLNPLRIQSLKKKTYHAYLRDSVRASSSPSR